MSDNDKEIARLQAELEGLAIEAWFREQVAAVNADGQGPEQPSGFHVALDKAMSIDKSGHRYLWVMFNQPPLLPDEPTFIPRPE